MRTKRSAMYQPLNHTIDRGTAVPESGMPPADCAEKNRKSRCGCEDGRKHGQPEKRLRICIKRVGNGVQPEQLLLRVVVGLNRILTYGFVGVRVGDNRSVCQPVGMQKQDSIHQHPCIKQEQKAGGLGSVSVRIQHVKQQFCSANVVNTLKIQPQTVKITAFSCCRNNF